MMTSALFATDAVLAVVGSAWLPSVIARYRAVGFEGTACAARHNRRIR